ncbi:hypothetical protein [Amycolatopsis solani]|uniref:hypothetical protein n=1 Tax=Amycolatopsis solani TaxID=3028615 RepID=UPI0025B029CA|nr:hypothetical protein [Amycolatopsis sp. MEP2-6]
MKLGRWLVLLAMGAAGCAGPTGGTAAPAAAPAPAKAEPDLLSLLPDAAAFPPHLTRNDVLAHRVFTLEEIAKSSSWNVFGGLVPAGSYRPAACTATSNPDAEPYAGTRFALDAYTFEDQANAIRPDQAIAAGATVARGTVDVAAVRAQADRCARVGDGDALDIRFTLPANPKADPDQVLAVKMTTGGDLLKLTYVAQVGGYVVTAYALCSKQPVCEAALKPVLAGGAAKARAA